MSPIGRWSGYAVRTRGRESRHAKPEQVVDVGNIAELADGGLESGDVAELVNLTAKRDHTAAGADLQSGREVAEAEGKSNADAVGKRLVPAGAACPARTPIDGRADEAGDSDGGATGGDPAARTGAGVEEEGCQCDDCGAGGGCRELEDPGHWGNPPLECVQEHSFQRTRGGVVTRFLLPGRRREMTDIRPSDAVPPAQGSRPGLRVPTGRRRRNCARVAERTP